jgi:putative transposase
MNHKKLRRLYREEGLQVRRRSGRKRAVGRRAPMTIPQRPNQRRSLDFASDALSDGRRFRILAIVDDFTRECLALIPDTSLPSLRVVRELDFLVAARGCPAMTRKTLGASREQTLFRQCLTRRTSGVPK